MWIYDYLFSLLRRGKKYATEKACTWQQTANGKNNTKQYQEQPIKTKQERKTQLCDK